LGNVAYSVTGLPSGVTASFSPNPAPGGNSTLTLYASTTAALGQYNARITGKTGNVTETALLPVTVAVPRFTISSYSQSSIGRGHSQAMTFYIQPNDGFTGSVSLSVSGLPSGVTALFSPATVNIAGQQANTTLTVSASASAALAESTVTVTGTSGGQTASYSFSLDVYAPSFSLGGYLDTSLGQGSSTNFYVYIGQQYGFSSNVNLSVTGLPSGVTASFSGNPTATWSMLTLSATSTAAVGQYVATLVGTSGTLKVTTPLQITVLAPSFTLETYSGIELWRGGSEAAYLYLFAQNGFNGNVTLSISGLPAGVTANVSPNPFPSSNSAPTLTLSANSSAPFGQYPITITGTSGSVSSSATILVTINKPVFTVNANNMTMGTGQSASYPVTAYPQYGFTGKFTFSVSGLPSGVTASLSPNPTTGFANLVVTASSTASLGAYPVTVTATSGSVSVSTTVELAIFQPTFTLTNYWNFTVNRGSSVSNYIYVSPQYGFSDDINFTATGLPPGVTASFSPNPVTVNFEETLLKLTAANSATIGSYNVTVTGTSGKQSSTVIIPLTVQAAP
jgi:uncharacterized membrane protein